MTKTLDFFTPKFIKKGIRFECQHCGTCCTGEPGTIYVLKDEIQNIAEFLQISRTELINKYMYPYKDSYSIKEHNSGDCLFFKNNSCLIYPVRPKQCSSYPFWFKNLRNHRAWTEESKVCPGIGKGRLFSQEELISILKDSVI